MVLVSRAEIFKGGQSTLRHPSRHCLTGIQPDHGQRQQSFSRRGTKTFCTESAIQRTPDVSILLQLTVFIFVTCRVKFQVKKMIYKFFKKNSFLKFEFCFLWSFVQFSLHTK